MFLKPIGDKIKDDVVNKISKDLLEDMLADFGSKNIDELVETLNESVIPDWCYEYGIYIVSKSHTGIFLYNDALYYIAETEKTSNFVMIKTKNLNYKWNLDEQYEIHTLGYNYIKIFGFDEYFGRVYLEAEHQTEFLHCYDIISENIMVYSNKMLIFDDGIPYVITNDKYLAFMRGEEVHKIKPYYDFERYIKKENYFLVVPMDINRYCFYPYCVTFEGKILRGDIEETRDYIWEEAIECLGFCDLKAYFPVYRENKKIQRPIELSFDSIIAALKSQMSDSELCIKNRYVIFEKMANVLMKYIKPDEDITHLLYTLYEINRVIDRNSFIFPSEMLHNRIKKIAELDDSEFRIAMNVRDYEKVKNILINGKSDCIDDKKEYGRIGIFSIGDDKCLRCTIVSKSQGMVIGSQIVPYTNMNEFDGMVSYDCSIDKFYIISRRPVPDEYKNRIIQNYKIPDNIYIFVVQS